MKNNLDLADPREFPKRVPRYFRPFSQRYAISRGAKIPIVLGLVLFTSLAFSGPFPFHIQIEAWSPYFLPKAAFVRAGTPVRWENPTATRHTITHDGCVNGGPCAFDSGVIPPSGVYDLAGLAPGRYAYHCTLHPIMRGVLVVTENLRASRT